MAETNGVVPRDGSRPRYARLGYVALNVTDLDRSARFYQTLWGLQPNGCGEGGSRYFRCSENHHDLILFQGQPGLKRIGWQMESESDVDRIAATLTANGCQVEAVSAAESASLCQSRSIRFSCPYTGATHEYFASIAQESEPWKPTLAKIARIGHIVLKTPKFEEAVRFYTDVLNFRTSDAIDDAVYFLRCFPNPLHHAVGLSKSTATGLHHVNFMVTELDDIGSAIWRFRREEIPIVRGPGRHPPSGSVFLYVLDPDSMTVEYSFGMEEFPEVNPRAHRVLPFAPESIDFWGGPTDPRLGKVGVVEPLR